jgi:hypothetical protein
MSGAFIIRSSSAHPGTIGHNHKSATHTLIILSSPFNPNNLPSYDGHPFANKSPLIYIPVVADISINGLLSNPNSVIVIPFIVCRALLISEVMVTCANVITEAKPNVIVKNKRIMFFIDNFFDQKVCILIDDRVKLFL